jgi:hypothetical protein
MAASNLTVTAICQNLLINKKNKQSPGRFQKKELSVLTARDRTVSEISIDQFLLLLI